MRTTPQENLVVLFRNRPSLAAEILGEVMGVALPPYTEARLASTNLTDSQPPNTAPISASFFSTAIAPSW